MEGPAHLACPGDGRRLNYDLPANGHELTFHADTGAWIEIGERGQTVTVVGRDLEEQIDFPRPLRFGYHWLKAQRGSEFQVRRFDFGNAAGGIEVAMHCDVSTPMLERIAWLERAGRISAKVTSESDPQGAAGQLDDAQALVASAGNPQDAALARHLFAQTLMVSGRNAAANDAFAAAAEAWSRVGNPSAALGARIGQAAGLVLSGSNQAVVDLTEPPDRLGRHPAYLLLRLEYERCLALQNLARLDEADRCYEWVLAGYHRLREDTEYRSALQAYASSKRDRGDFDGAERLFEESLREARGPYAHSIRGRNLLALADVSLRRGDVARALQQLNAALEEFSLYKSARWQGNVYMKLADLYGELGSYDEAYAALAQAVQRFSARDDAPRFATAILSFATLERHNGHALSALAWAAVAESMYRRLDLPGRADSARLLTATLRSEGALPALPDPQSIGPAPAEEAGQWHLLRARLALAQGRRDAARSELEQLARMPLLLTDRVQATTLGAELREHDGDSAGAQAMLLDEAARIDVLARRARSDVLRFVIAREAGALRRTGLRLLLEHDRASGTAAADIWRWLAGQADAGLHGVALGDDARGDAFDRAVAGELLVAANDRANPAAEAAARRELLARLAGPSGADTGDAAATTLSLAQFRAALPQDSALVAYVDGGSRTALLWLTRDDARLLAAASSERVRADAVALQSAARDAGVPVGDVRAAARRLADDLFTNAGPLPPRRLYVLADPALRGVPWSVLQWPGSERLLLETTAVAAVRLSHDPAPAAASLARPRAIAVAVAAQRDAANPSLPVLGGAEVEAARIRSAAAPHDIAVVEDGHATRASVERALSAAGGWVHVAAHGIAEPQRIGYAGLWLEPAAPDTSPAFLSWIDVLDHGVRNDLVVLDACQTGDSGTAVNGNLSFADAVARAGARRVVAVSWPVSDTASAIWVPAFYAALIATPDHDVADALRSAQRQLSATRAFSHPFYWAGMQTIERWPIGGARAAEHPAVARTLKATR